MSTLFHYPICPHSRFVRLILEEYNQPPSLIEERAWERRPEFLELNPAGTTPVLVEEGAPPVPGAAVIAEYIDEVVGTTFGKGRLLPLEANPRIEVRRLTNWFNEKFFAEVSGPLVTERVYKRYIPFDNGGGSPDTETLRAAKSNIKYHLAYIGWLVRAPVGRGLSGRCAVGRRRDSEELVRADQIAPVVPRAIGRETVRSDAVDDLRQSRFLTPDPLKAGLIEAARALGFDAIGIARPDSLPEAAARLRAFLETGAHGDMT